MFSKPTTTKNTNVKLNNPHRKWMIIGIVTILVFGGAGAYFVSRSHAGTCQDTELINGSRGECVKALQNFLNTMGYKDKDGLALDPDGKFGARTEQAVRRAQADVKVAVDGRYGPKTKQAMCKVAQDSKNESLIAAANQTACNPGSGTPSTGGSPGSTETKDQPGTDSNPGGNNNGTGAPGNSGTTNNGSGSSASNSGSSGNPGRPGSSGSITCSISAHQYRSKPADANPKLVVTNNSDIDGPVEMVVGITGGSSGTQVKTFNIDNLESHSSRIIVLYSSGFSASSTWGATKMTVGATGLGGSPQCQEIINGRIIGASGPRI